MKQLFLVTALLYTGTHLQAQCLSGNCKDGIGKYDYSWCVYEGEFKNGNMDGNGTIDYGGGEKYTGQFKNGKEDGRGTLTHANGTKEEVAFSNGQRVLVLQAATIESNYVKPKDGCETGNCENGRGTYVYPSGNKYVGEFKNSTRDGQGSCFFANGDRFEGTFHNNEFASGTYTYATGYRYSGTYDANGKELNGIYTAPSGNTAEMRGGAVIPPPPPKIPPGQYKQIVECPVCHGKRGFYAAGKGTTWEKTPDSYIRTVDKWGTVHSELVSVGLNVEHHDYGHFEECSKCHGKGVIVVDQPIPEENR